MGVMVSLCSLAPGRAAETFSIDWYSLDAGGVSSRGGNFALSATIGQPETGTLRGGDFEWSGGVRAPVLVVPSPLGPTLLVQYLPGAIRISWEPPDDSYSLESSTDLSVESWRPSPSGNPIRIPITETVMFYRLVKQ